MKKEGIYPNAPIVEAVFEIRFTAEPSIECRRDEYYEKIRNKYPKVFVPLIAPMESPSLKVYQFKSEDGRKIIQFCINRFSFHMYKESYNQGGFFNFSRECLKYLNSFCDLYEISKLKRTGLRYINHIAILKEAGDIIPIERYLKLKYGLPSSIPQKFNSFHTALVIPKGNGKLNILVEYQKLPDPQRTDIIRLDFDYYLEKNLIVKELGKYLSGSHYHTKRVFLDLISNEYKKALH